MEAYAQQQGWWRWWPDLGLGLGLVLSCLLKLLLGLVGLPGLTVGRCQRRRHQVLQYDLLRGAL